MWELAAKVAMAIWDSFVNANGKGAGASRVAGFFAALVITGVASIVGYRIIGALDDVREVKEIANAFQSYQAKAEQVRSERTSQVADLVKHNEMQDMRMTDHENRIGDQDRRITRLEAIPPQLNQLRSDVNAAQTRIDRLTDRSTPGRH